MTTVTEDVDLPGIEDNFTTPVTITISVVGENGRDIRAFHASTGVTLISPNKFRLDSADTTWSLDLLPNDELTPSGTTYKRVVTVGTKFQSEDFFFVPDMGGPFSVQDLLTDPPETLESSALATHAADTTLHAGSELFYAERAATSDIVVPAGSGASSYIPITGAEGVVTVPDRPYVLEFGVFGVIADSDATAQITILIDGDITPEILLGGSIGLTTAGVASQFFNSSGFMRVPNAYHAPTPGDMVAYALGVRRVSGTGTITINTTDDEAFGRNGAVLRAVTT